MAKMKRPNGAFHRISNYINDSSKDLQSRTFFLMSFISFLVLLVIFIWDIFIGETLAKLLFLGIGLFTMAFIVVLSVVLHRVQLGATLISLIMIFVLLPAEFFTGGGVNGCTPIWYAYAFMFVGINLKGRKKYILLCGIPLSAIACYLIAFWNVDLLTIHDMRTAYLDSIASLIAVGAALYISVDYLIRLFLRENRITKKQKEEIEELVKSQNRFFSSMSHEIRTPISTIIGLNEMTLREETNPEISQNALTIQSASKLLLTTINDILDLSKIESGKMEILNHPYNVGSMLSEIVNMIWARCREKELEFHVDADSHVPKTLIGDEIRIKQILINILNNSIKYTGRGSITLSIQCRNTEEEGKVLITFSVEDTGIGIKKENIPTLFDAFKRADLNQNRNVEGTGLGLSIVKQLVDIMGGEVSVNSIYTKGTTFYVTLPQEVGEEEELGNFAVEMRRSLRGKDHYRQSFEAPKARLLIVDDNEANLMVESKLLRDTKIQIDTAESGQECLDKTRNNTYHCIFMDHLMPGMDGIECMEKIRTQPGGLNKHVPIIVLTANAGSENQELYRKSGFNDYILKPVNGMMLEKVLVKFLPKELVYLTNGDQIEESEEELFRQHVDKKPILLTTESPCGLPTEMLKNMKIPVLPFRIFTDDGDFLDGKEVEADGLLDYIETPGKKASSKEPTVQDYENFFAAQLTVAQEILHISAADGMSKSYLNACEAAKAFDNVTVFDSGQISGGLGLVVLSADQLLNTASSVAEIVQALNDVKTRVRTSVAVNSPDFLVLAGFFTERAAKIANAFMLHPVMRLKNGHIKIQSLLMGNLERAWERYIRRELTRPDSVDDETAIVNYVGLDLEQQERIEKLIREEVNFKNLIFQKGSPAISANYGPLSMGIMFMRK